MTFLENHALHILVGSLMSHGALCLHMFKRWRHERRNFDRITKLVRWAEANDVDGGVIARISLLRAPQHVVDYDWIDLKASS
jgi:hypothetical protein